MKNLLLIVVYATAFCFTSLTGSLNSEDSIGIQLGHAQNASMTNSSNTEENNESVSSAIFKNASEGVVITSEGDKTDDVRKLLRDGKFEEAIPYYDRALETNPNNGTILVLKGVALGDSGRPEEGIPYIDRAIDNEPNNILALQIKGLVDSSFGKPEEAITYFNRALAINSSDVISLGYKGIALAKLGKSDEAITYFDKSLAINQNNTDILNAKGLALINTGKYEEAVTSFDKVLAIDPNNQLAQYQKIIALGKLNIDEKETPMSKTYRED